MYRNYGSDIIKVELPVPAFDAEGFSHYCTLLHVEHSDRVIEGLQLVFVELPKFSPQTYTEKKMMVLWLCYLTEINEKTCETPADLLRVKQEVSVLSLLI